MAHMPRCMEGATGEPAGMDGPATAGAAAAAGMVEAGATAGRAAVAAVGVGAAPAAPFSPELLVAPASCHKVERSSMSVYGGEGHGRNTGWASNATLQWLAAVQRTCSAALSA